ncbi:MAG: hypothetical protein P8099_13380 [Gemmatimonadota bacterium]|jgi:hypothetical protein
MEHYEYSAAVRLTGGMITGLVAGAIMALVAMCRALVMGLGFWTPMKLVAATYFGLGALIAGGGAVDVGIVTHLVLSALAGAVFGLLFGNWLHKASALAVGVLYGVAIWALNTWVVLPWLNVVMLQRELAGPGWWWTLHVTFGGFMLFMPPIVHALGRRRPTAARPQATPAAA